MGQAAHGYWATDQAAFTLLHALHGYGVPLHRAHIDGIALSRPDVGHHVRGTRGGLEPVALSRLPTQHTLSVALRREFPLRTFLRRVPVEVNEHSSCSRRGTRPNTKQGPAARSSAGSLVVIRIAVSSRSRYVVSIATPDCVTIQTVGIIMAFEGMPIDNEKPTWWRRVLAQHAIHVEHLERGRHSSRLYASHHLGLE